ncbi:MAG: glycosyltransferase [Candidatus Limnocylindrales bacterium]
MRILMAARTSDPTTSGSALFTFRLAAGLHGAGHEVVLLAAAPRSRARGPVQVSVVTSVPLWPFSTVERIPLLPRRHVEAVMDCLQPDVVHVQDHFLVSRATIDVACQRGVPVLATNHFLPDNVLPFLPVPARARRPLEQFLWRGVTSAFRRADLVTTPSETGVGWLRSAGLDNEVLAVSCGVDLEVFRPDPQVDRLGLRRRLGLEQDRITLVYVGRLERDKRLDDLLRALAHPSLERIGGNRRPQLILVGRGRDSGRYRRLVSRLGLSRRVAFTGRVRRQALVEILNAADIFVMPSPAELQSIATLEAMAVGLPVVAAAAGALPELVRPGLNGRLFRPADPDDAARQLAALADEQAAWPQMAEASRAIAARHALPATVTRYEAIYGSLVARAHRPSNPPLASEPTEVPPP